MADAWSPPVCASSCLRYSTPARTLSTAESGSSFWLVRFCWIQFQVPGITCMTPRALAPETMPLLNPLSCQAMADASEPGTPCSEAIEAMVPESTRVGVGSGATCGTISAGAGSEARGGVGEPEGSLSTVPASRTPAGSRPFMAAIWLAGTPAVAARPDRVSPQRTV